MGGDFQCARSAIEESKNAGGLDTVRKQANSTFQQKRGSERETVQVWLNL
jgi:hypothetical protein